MKYVIAVRALCEFTAKQGDLDLRFTPSPSSQEGIAGHAIVASRRSAGYQSEISLTGEYKHLTVRGRADGYDSINNRLEEVKTFRGELETMPDNHRQLHWAQLKIYGWLLCQKLSLCEVNLALVYFDIVSKKETSISELCSADALKCYFEEHCERFLDWAGQELAHREKRDQALTALAFPYSSFRAGQRQLAEAVYKVTANGRCLIAQATTGIGKTIGTLFPVLKAAPGQQLDKVFFLTAKTSGRATALDALERITTSQPGMPLRVLELVARDKACEHPDKACHGESCPLAKGFYDRLPAARKAALANETLTKASVRAAALAHQVCPYYLSHDLVRWSDVVVGDYNYYFDLSALLHSLTIANQWRVGILVDEAHNLIERARKMYTAELDQAHFKIVRKTAPAALKKTFDTLNRRWNELHQERGDAYQAHDTLPAKFITALQHTSSAITDYLTQNPGGAEHALQQFYFDALHFSHLSELFDTHSLFDVARAPVNGAAKKTATTSVLCIRNIIPAAFLAPRFAATQSAVLFSATLSPWQFYNDTLGLPQYTAWLDVESPFRPEQLAVRVVSRISTRYQDREASLSPMVDLMAAQYRQQPGNYLTFLSSFDYLFNVASLFQSRYPDIPMWQQARRMNETERELFLERFTPTSQGIGFAVLGGAFAEGIDLPGQRLIGAFIATLGLPQINPVNEQVRQRMDFSFGNGYNYAYLYPGIQKVVQAAGRVIRTPSDQGVVYLIDDRFGRLNVRSLLPRWWQVQRFVL